MKKIESCVHAWFSMYTRPMWMVHAGIRSRMGTTWRVCSFISIVMLDGGQKRTSMHSRYRLRDVCFQNLAYLWCTESVKNLQMLWNLYATIEWFRKQAQRGIEYAGEAYIGLLPRNRVGVGQVGTVRLTHVRHAHLHQLHGEHERTMACSSFQWRFAPELSICACQNWSLFLIFMMNPLGLWLEHEYLLACNTVAMSFSGDPFVRFKPMALALSCEQASSQMRFLCFRFTTCVFIKKIHAENPAYQNQAGLWWNRLMECSSGIRSTLVLSPMRLTPRIINWDSSSDASASLSMPSSLNIAIHSVRPSSTSHPATMESAIFNIWRRYFPRRDQVKAS